MGVSPYTGYGRLALGFVKGLHEIGVVASLFNPDAPTLVIGPAEALNATHVCETRRWSYVLLESDQPAWALVQALNKSAEKVFVPTDSIRLALQCHGVTSPIFVLSPGLDLFVIDEPLTDRMPHDPFTFLTYSYGDQRKGADLAIAAFQAEFHDDVNVHLRIKTREGYELGWLTEVGQSNISLIKGCQSEQDWQETLRSSDCFVFPSRAEGWGMPPREATIQGVPTIATNWLGLNDIEQWGLPVAVKELRPCQFHNNPFNANEGHWAEPDIDDLRRQMRWVLENFSTAREIALRGRDYLLRRHRWKNTALELRKHLLDY